MRGLGDHIKRLPRGLGEYLDPGQSGQVERRPRANGASWYEQLAWRLADPSGAPRYPPSKPLRMLDGPGGQAYRGDSPLIGVGQTGLDTDNDNYPRNYTCTTASYNCLSNLPSAKRMSCITAENACKRVSFAARSFPSNVPFFVNYPDGGRVVIQGGTGNSLYIPPRPNIRGP
jgi:hypothetical protein